MHSRLGFCAAMVLLSEFYKFVCRDRIKKSPINSGDELGKLFLKYISNEDEDALVYSV